MASTPSQRFMIASVLAFVAVCVGIFVFLFGKTGSKIRLGDTYTVSAVLPSAEQLSPTSNVRAAGVNVGSVRDVEPLETGEAKVTFELKDSFAPLTRDARLLVRTKTLLGENYLSIDPGAGRGGEVPDGGTIPVSQADDAVELDQILSVFDASTRASLRRNLRASAATFSGRGADVNRALGAAAPTVRDAATVAGILRRQRGQVHAVARNAGQVLQSIAERRDQLQVLIRQGKRTADIVSARDEQLADTVRSLPGLLQQVRTTSGRLAGFAPVATPVVNDLASAGAALGPALTELEPSAEAARRLFSRVPRLVRAADPLLSQLASFSTAARPLTQELEPLLKTLNPGFKYLAPYRNEVSSFFANVGGVNNAYDAAGGVIRVLPLFGAENLGLLDEDGRALYEQLQKVTGLEQIQQLRTNQYPRPGNVSDPKPGDGQVPQLPSDP